MALTQIPSKNVARGGHNHRCRKQAQLERAKRLRVGRWLLRVAQSRRGAGRALTIQGSAGTSEVQGIVLGLGPHRSEDTLLILKCTAVTLSGCSGCDLLPVPGESPALGGKATSPLKTGSASDRLPGLSCSCGRAPRAPLQLAAGRSGTGPVQQPQGSSRVQGRAQHCWGHCWVVTRPVRSIALGLP